MNIASTVSMLGALFIASACLAGRTSVVSAMAPIITVDFRNLVSAADGGKPAENLLMTKWGKQLKPDNVLAEYPRPQMVRKDWQNLNGLWEFAVTKKADYIVKLVREYGTYPITLGKYDENERMRG